ncbi:MAG: DUF3179 domain-containing protein [bacterium]|nr:DUF3179 domain-containing protein [bacterium]
MSNQIKIIVPILILLGVGVFWYFINRNINKNSEIDTASNSSIQNTKDDNTIKELGFENKGLKTNTAKASIPLDLILDGGPSKDGIPALTNPKFINVKETNIAGDVDGMVVSVGNITKFYPFSIMVWHEIVNDTVNGKPLVITFCPLCGSAIAFDTTDQFGVSGKLYESNLLMYDKSTESLWSQSIGTAVVGDRIGEELVVYSSQLMSFKDFKTKYPNGQILSTNTGHNRDYSFYPYRDYNDNESIFFPISVKDNRFPVKELMYVVNAYDKSIAFPVKQLNNSVVPVAVGDKKITATLIDGEIIVKDDSGKILPGYNEMWFSWATQHQKDGVVWKK